MTIRKNFAIALLGCAALAGCDHDHYDADNTKQGTFATTDTASNGQTPQTPPATSTTTGNNPPNTAATTTTTPVVLLTGPLSADIDKLINDATALQATQGLSDASRQGLMTILADANALKTAYGMDPTANITPQLDTLTADLVTLSTNADISGQLAGLTEDLDYLRPRTDVPLTQYVNLFVGTQMATTGSGFSGNDNPGAQTPFGMVSFSPDTMTGYTYDYRYTDKNIEFFSMTHLNGTGCTGEGAVALLPTNDGAQSPTAGATFSHANESAEPGYYKVTLDNGITTELTATTRTGMMQLSYADATKAYLILDTKLNSTYKGSELRTGTTDVQIGADGLSLSGNAVASPFCSATWTQPVYFYATFDKPLTSTSASTNGVARLQFNLTDADKTVHVRVGISSVSSANAKLNLDAENSALSFDAIRKQASDTWNHRLNTVQLDLGKPGEVDKLATDAEKTAALDNLGKFYTAFYRIFSGPTVYSDVNGDYRSMHQADLTAPSSSKPDRATENVANYPFKVDGNDAGYKTHYTGYSLWDTYRSDAQLIALVAPDEASDMMESLVADAEQCGAFPHWADGSEDATPMQGNHAPNVIAGSYAFGATKFDLEKARSYIIKGATDPASACNDKLSVGGNIGAEELPGYLTQGYIAPLGPARWMGSSATIEMVNSDRSSAAFLSRLPTAGADTATITSLFDRSQNWANIFNTDPAVMALAAKDYKGNWEAGSFHEGTEPQYLWSFPHDWSSLIGKLGGKTAAVTRLNTLFGLDATTPLDPTKEPAAKVLNSGQNGQTFYIGNEPSFQAPWAYNWAGAPQNAQYILPVIMRKDYTLTPDGLPGNDDMGATSAWYVLAALGLYPVIPSEPGLAISTPQFSGANLWLGNGRKLRISTDKQAMLDDVRYINEMKLNDTVYQGSWLPLARIANGGRLSYTLSPTPTTWGTDPALTPPSGPNADYSQATATPPAGAVQLIK